VKRITVAATLVALIIVGSALAAWLATSSGFARGKMGKLQPLVLTEVAFPGEGDLLPGGNGKGVLRVQNPNAFPMTIQAVDAGIPTNIAGTQPGCETADIAKLTANDLSGLNVSVPGNSTTSVEIPNLFSLGADSPSQCQETEWRVPVAVTARNGNGS
jgi:hypothetical protein